MSELYTVVKNDEGALSIWAIARGRPPRGWTPRGEAQDKAGCLRWIEAQADAVAMAVETPAPRVVVPPPGGPWSAGAATVVPFPRPEARERLYVFPHAGSGVTYYHFLARALEGPSVEVVLVLYPGRELRMRDETIDDMGELVSLLLEELALDRDDRPYRFFGHSMGALAAFELSHRLAAAGRRGPEALYLSGRQPPHTEINVLKMEGLSDEAFLDAVGHRYGAIPQAILENRDLCALILRSMRADFVLMQRYEWVERPPLAQPMVLLNGTGDRWIKPDEVGEWSRYTTAAVASHFFEGDHFYLSANAAGLAAVLGQR